MSGIVAGNKRRAFRDVTNAKRHKSGKSETSLGLEKQGEGRASNKGKSQEIHGVAAVSRSTTSDSNATKRSTRSSSLQTRAKKVPVFKRPPNTLSNSSYQYSGKTDDIDERDFDDPNLATEYVEDMYTHYRERELTASVRPNYMESQPHINERMRSILIDWLVEVHLKFKLVPDALYLTVNIIDRYLERKEINRPKLQLLGVSALLIASKYEEIYPPDLRDLVYICDRAYTRQDVLDMEEKILKALDYRITVPSAHTFIVRYLKAAHADLKIVRLSCFVLDGTLQSYKLLNYLPSQLAAAAVLIARYTVGRNAWSPTLLKYAEYCEEEILPVARAILTEHPDKEDELYAVHKKYSMSRFGCVADIELKCDG